jgi:hypothetical protein
LFCQNGCNSNNSFHIFIDMKYYQGTVGSDKVALLMYLDYACFTYISWFEMCHFCINLNMYTNVGWFLNAHPILNLILKPILLMKTDWHVYMWEPNWKLTSGSHVWWKLVQIYIYMEFKSNFQSFCINCWLLFLFFSHGAIVFLLLILFFSHCSYFFLIATILLTWYCYFHVMK